MSDSLSQAPLVRLYTPAHATAALRAAAETRHPVRLLGLAGGPAALGVAWLPKVVAEAARAYPQARWQAIVDCADAPGHALACLEAGVEAIAVRGLDAATTARLRAIADTLGATLVVDTAPNLDLLDHPDPVTACRTLLDR